MMENITLKFYTGNLYKNYLKTYTFFNTIQSIQAYLQIGFNISLNYNTGLKLHEKYYLFIKMLTVI